MVTKADSNERSLITVWVLNLPRDKHSKYQGHLINVILTRSCWKLSGKFFLFIWPFLWILYVEQIMCGMTSLWKWPLIKLICYKTVFTRPKTYILCISLPSLYPPGIENVFWSNSHCAVNFYAMESQDNNTGVFFFVFHWLPIVSKFRCFVFRVNQGNVLCETLGQSRSIREKGILKRLYDCDITLPSTVVLLLKWIPVRDAILESIAEFQLPLLPQCLLSKYILYST